jgi:putative heme-binding domain-containing protein
VGRRGIELSPFENYEQWQQAKTDSKKKAVPKFWTVPGFEVTELRVAQADEGSWISLAFDPQGKMIISREDQGFLRMTLAEPRKSISRVEAIASDLKECRGLAFDGEWLYASANNSLGLYRLQIDADGKAQKQESLRQFPGKVGHGRNDIVFGRKNRGLYQIHGDSVELPKDNFRDLTSPLNESKTKTPGREGSLVRCDADGSNWELICAGLRNPYGIDLHRSGEPFTFDADNEHDMGTPWYRPTRILHLMTGGDTGYRESTGVLPPRFHDQPDHAPPVIDIGRSSPTSVMFGYDLKFPEPYKSALFALDWTYGRVIAVHLAPRGESFRAATELFLQGRPLNVTDVAAGPDGDMYLITGGRKTQSALYRISYVGKAGRAESPAWRGNHEPEAVEFLQRKRNQMDSFQFLTADPAARHRARIELERGDLERLRQLIEIAKPSTGLPQLVLQLALARARRSDDVPLLLNSLKECKLAQLELSQQFAWLRVVGLCRETAPEIVAGRREVLLAELVSLAKTLQRDPKLGTELRVAPEGTSDELRRRVVLLLGELSAEELPALATTLLFQSVKQEDQLAGLLATREATKGWTPESRREQLRVLNEIPRMVGGAGLPPFEKWLRPQIMKSLSKEEALALADSIEPKTAAVASEPLPPPRKHVQKWTLEDLTSLHDANAPAGDPQKGAMLFRDALCSRCHRVNLKGAAVGPDLTHVSRRFSRRDILESIVQPSLSVAENFRMETVLTEAGKVYTGRVLNEGDYRRERLTLQIDPLQPDKIVELDKKEITEHRTLPVSPMPTGLLDTFTREEIRDLLAYLAP